MPGGFPSGRVSNGLPEPPTAAETIPHQRHGGQRRAGIVPQPHLDLQYFHIHAADSAGHPALAFPPADTFEPSDGHGADGPLPAPEDHRCRYSACCPREHHMFHACTVWPGSDNPEWRLPWGWRTPPLRVPGMVLGYIEAWADRLVPATGQAGFDSVASTNQETKHCGYSPAGQPWPSWA